MVENLYFFSIIVILLIVIGYMYLKNANTFNYLINGFYEADASFCKESGVETFCIYFDNDIQNNERSCYILAKKDNDIIINEPCTVKLVMNFETGLNLDAKYFRAEFKNISDTCAEVFPLMQNLQYYPMIGKIIIHNGDTVTFVGYKNGINTEMKSHSNDKDKYIDSE